MGERGQDIRRRDAGAARTVTSDPQRNSENRRGKYFECVAGTPELYDDDLTKAQASKRIDEMREKANVT